jgi:hypothetical protein
MGGVIIGMLVFILLFHLLLNVISPQGNFMYIHGYRDGQIDALTGKIRVSSTTVTNWDMKK